MEATLVAALVSLVGVIVWAVRFVLTKLLGRDGESGVWGRFMSSFDELKGSVKENTESVKGFEAEQQKTNELLCKMAEESPAIGDETLRGYRRPESET